MKLKHKTLIQYLNKGGREII